MQNTNKKILRKVSKKAKVERLQIRIPLPECSLQQNLHCGLLTQKIVHLICVRYIKRMYDDAVDVPESQKIKNKTWHDLTV